MSLLYTVKEIKDYISKYKKDSSGSWEYQHTPYLEKVLNSLNEIESKVFSEEIWNWSEFHLYEIADPILFCKNKYLDDYLYVKIFSKINNINYLDYLVQNVIYNIRPPYYSSDDIQNWEIEIIIAFKKNVLRVIEVKDNEWEENLKEVVSFLNNEIRTLNV